MIKLEHVEKDFGNVMPFSDINAEINDGDVISVIGPSGTGKSTLLRCINMLDGPTNGKIFINGEEITAKGADITKLRQKMGMVFQSFNLFGHLTVIENIMFSPINLLNMSKQDAYDKGMMLLNKVGLGSKALSYPDELSGGQKQRVAIVRALAMDPEIILFDEPTSALDPSMTGEVEAVIRELADAGTTMMIVTHDMQFARSVCNRVFYLDEGGIYEEGPPEQVFDNPLREKTRRFIYHKKVFETVLQRHEFDFLGIFSDIREYGYKNKIDFRLIEKIQSAIEELAVQIVNPELSDDTAISLLVECAEDSDESKIVFCYGGDLFNPADTENDIAWKIISHTADKIVHECINEEEFTNRITCTLTK